MSKATSAITRRTFVRRIAAAGTVAAAAPFAAGEGLSIEAQGLQPALPGLPAAPAVLAPPVVSFHMDQPYLDVSGKAVPYHPPRGLRSAQSLAELSDEAFHCLLT